MSGSILNRSNTQISPTSHGTLPGVEESLDIKRARSREFDEGQGGEASGVDVDGAGKAFAELRRQLTHVSTTQLSQSGQLDAEKGKGKEIFDLVEYMRGVVQARDENGSRPKQIGVVFENLGVAGMGGIKLPIFTFPDAVIGFFMAPIIPIIQKIKNLPPKQIIHPMSGFLKPGEMCMVLGRPNSGCSTLLKVLANQREGFVRVDGDVSYGGISADLMAKQYGGEVVYNPEDDVHFATLTVYQTLKFALMTKTPGKLLPNLRRKEFVDQIMNVLLQMLGISHTKNTLVGDATVRGVSGGERKRVSIAEMMATRACVLSWDNSTRGLDASTALEYAKSLRIMTNIFSTTMFVTLYQAGEGIYEQFDKVIVLNEGRMVYFGPAKEARAYMVSLGYKNLPRQTTADYLTGCTDPNERQFQDGIDPTQVPTSPEDMERAYKNSEIFQRMEDERVDYTKFINQELRFQQDFMEAVRKDQNKGVSKKSPYTVSVLDQMRALVMRDIQLSLQDRKTLIFDAVTVVGLAVVLGTVFLDLPLTTAGGFTRGGVIFMGLLFNTFMSFSDLPKVMLGRPIVWRQTGFKFYRPGARSLASVIADVPFQFPKVFVFCLILYLMSNLSRSAGALFFFILVTYITTVCMSSAFKVMGAVSFNFDIASRLASSILMALVTYSGYMIPKASMKDWLVWIYYIDPLNYAFSALMINEFRRIDLLCEGGNLAPRGDGYPQQLGPNQACTFLGSQPGVSVVRGRDYIQVAFEYNIDHMWRNFGIVVAFTVALIILLFILVEVFSTSSGMPAINVFAKENKERKELNAKLQSLKSEYRSGKKTQDLSGLISTKKPFTWQALTYDVPVSGGQKRLLNEIYGYVKPGTLTALMGSSGAGKTTLLDVLANRKTTGVIGGTVLMAGRKPGASFQRGTAYCEQMDVHEWTATVREAMRFSAYLRQPAETSIEDKNAYVEEVIQLLELEDLADAMVGFPGFGLGVEARKRLTIGVELAAKPQLLLFLDEPTSGLDGQSAYNIVRFLRKLASAGQAILCTIHQPNALLFEHFDRLLLLKKGGRCVYFGGIGQDSHILRGYFERNGALCPDNANPAEFMLEAIGGGTSSPMGGDKDWADRWLESPEHAENCREIERLNEESARLFANEVDDSGELQYATPFMYQLKTVVNRTNLSFYRNSNYEFTRLFNHVIISLLVGLTFLNVGNNIAQLQQRIFAIFQAVILIPLIMAQVEPMFIMARDTYLREASSKMYAPAAFGIAQFLAEMPYSFLCAVFFYVIWYFVVSFQSASNRAGYTFLMIMLVELYAVTIGQAVAALSPSMFIAQRANTPIVMVLTTFCGVSIPFNNLPKFWRSWLYEINPMTRFVGGVVANEFHQLIIQCAPAEYSVFEPPANQTCTQWAGNFVSSFGGYLDNPGATSGCRYCQYRSGDDYLMGTKFEFGKRWREFGIFAAFIVLNMLATVFGATFLTHLYAKR
ncbi:ABC-2 type transporter-domain-containing protein [Phakopsora pachyrhizi]|uniref:ABC-2 type transporter-domain-containing protein n=1 Tax=Phakopsora pachyrhizi TaxID=170000 RepID=A0AAV0BIR0_PHAPC|nr:ABC-2 type transporter-domain-containing protein [Phakopsora pachyrhizi]CAH7685997.1 ABC-2 type transporter-domain-containing protein [Phakopsora pachyrhizi]